MLALTIAEARLELTCFGIHQICGVFVGILAKKGVGERAVSPPETEQMETNQEQRQGIGHVVDLMRRYIPAHDDAVRQREGQVAGH